MSSFKICAPLTLALSACISVPGQSETALVAGVGPYSCQPLPAPAEQVAFVQRNLNVSRNGLKLNATLGLPGEMPPKALVVFLHGYTGTRDEIQVRGGEGMFLRAARAFAQQGIASVRFDFIGSGDSDGVWQDTTFRGQTEDTRTILEALISEPGVNDVPVHLLGFSQGGLVALRAAAEGMPLRSVILWNPVLDPRQTYARLFSAAGLEAGLKLAKAGDLGAMVPGTGLKASFFADIEASDPIKTGAGFTQPVLAITGRLDGIADNGTENAEKLKLARRGSTAVVTVPGDHALGATRSAALIDEVIGCSVGFVARRSGLISGNTSLAPLQ